MKAKYLVVATLTALSISAGALADTVIGDAMKDMASALKTIVGQASDASQNASSAQLCDQMLKDIATARPQTPEKVANLPSDQQASQETAYQQALDQLASQVTQLKNDFVANNNAAAANDLNAINQTKIAGHKQFKQN